ncbi:MAG: hypothetical protein KDA20_01385 [Phycisphaerales bacterium]|nr:hypothetical protein [Phycisphaerales bacterium]
MSRRTAAWPCRTLVLALVTTSGVACGQSADPKTVDPSLAIEAEQLAKPQAPPMEVAPADAVPGLLGDASPVPQPALIREGAVLSQRVGVLRRLRGGGWAFLSAAPDGSRLALVLLPSTRLTEMTRLVESTNDPIGFEISGQVYAYRGRNYLLPTRFHTTASQDAPLEHQPSSSKPTPAAEDTSPFGEGVQGLRSTPSIDELLADVEERSGVATPLPAILEEGGADTASNDAAHGLAMLREGTVVSARLGRMRPSTVAGGSGWMLIADADADTAGDALTTLPLLLMPCQNLQGMERLVGEYGDALRFTVSGVVYVFEGQNYLLPTMYLVELDRSGNLTSAQ